MNLKTPKRPLPLEPASKSKESLFSVLSRISQEIEDMNKKDKFFIIDSLAGAFDETKEFKEKSS